MQRLTLSELLHVTNTGEEALKSMRRRGQIALAFGLRDAFASSWYLPVDAVSMLVTSALAKVYGVSNAAVLVRISGDVLLQIVAGAEADTDTDAMLCVMDLVRERDGVRAYFVSCAAVDAFLPELPRSCETHDFVPERLIMINVSQVIRALRVSALRIGVDLTAPFLPPPDSLEFQKLMASYSQLPHTMVELHTIKKRDALARKIGAKARAFGGGSLLMNKPFASKAA
ncbi:hypothetical protein JQ616_38975 [Bradyrhizobium tropiciagri]|uniref:hypothetical protein n=1 Tax=Bradyrhizobium tropiciagri TaxID=312253 RepID=UPI001BAB5834|nr:hypothetical protein [Bradyrhizobium tropiciagri]MBR0900976.1 hypothetical protein [Bradyrhizobium tropiciagri]